MRGLALAILLAIGPLAGTSCAGGGAPGPGPDGFADVPADGPADAPRELAGAPEAFDPGAADPAASDVAGADPAGGPSDAAPETPADASPDGPDALSITSVAPGSGPAGASTTVTVRGTGFVDGMDVFFGPRKGLYPFVLSPTAANVTAPPSGAGTVDVRAVRPDGSAATLPAAFAYQGSLTLASVDPATGPSGGGTPVTIRGAGFEQGPRFLFGGREAPVVRVVDDGTALVVTPPGDPGPATVLALSGDASARLTDGFAFVDEGVPPSDPSFTVTGCSPATGSPAGGTTLTLAGTGFRPGASVRVGALPARDVAFVSATRMTAVTPPGSPGPARILVRQSTAGAWLDGAFEYADGSDPEILAVDPPDGSWAGGTLVHLEGRNLSGVRQVFFGGTQATDVRVVSSVRVDARTPRVAEAGTVPLMVLGDGGALGADYTYFDPYLAGGGTWGGPLRGALNVTVTNSFTGRGLLGAYVIVGNDPHTRFQGRTDDRGQITLSEDGFRGPVVVTAGGTGFTASTIAGFDARNVTLSIGPAASPESPGQTPGTIGGTPTCRVRGRVKDYGKYLVKPPWVENTPYVLCGTTASSLFGGGIDPGPKAVPDSEGRFELVSRTGTFGVLCQMLAVDSSKGWAVPLRLGMVRRVACKAGDVVDGLEVSLDVETDADLWVATGPPPTHPSGTGQPGFSGGWELGEDGWLPLFQRYVRRGSQRVLFPNQPRSFDPPLDGLGYGFYVTISAATPIGLPYSTVLGMEVPPAGPWPVLLEDGAGFQALPTSLRREITAMAPTGDGHALAVDAGGSTWDFDGTAFQTGPYRASRPLYAVWASGPDDFWVAGARGLVQHVTADGAVDVPSPVATDVLAISGEAPDAVSIGGGPYLMRLVDGQFAYESLPAGSDVKALQRFPGGEVVAAGAGGAVITGRVGDVFGVMRPIARDLRAVAGLSRDEVWVVGDGGTVIRLTPDDVTVVTVPGEPDLFGAVPVGPSNVVLFGAGGTVLQYDGTHFTDRSRPDLQVDLEAGASVGGHVVLAGRHYLQLPRFLPFPQVFSPADAVPWDGRTISWTLGGTPAEPTYSQALLSGPTGATFWVVLSGGDVREVDLPDLSHVLGTGPIPAGAKRMNLTVVRQPGFDIDGYGYQDMSYYDRESFSVSLTSFP